MSNILFSGKTNPHKFLQSCSSFFKTKVDAPLRRSFDFTKVLRTQHRLDTLINWQKPVTRKFKRLGNCKQVSLWNKWKYHEMPSVLAKGLKRAGESNVPSREEQTKYPAIQGSSFKLRVKMKEVLRLKQDIAKARENSRIVKLMQETQQTRINRFFDGVEQYISNHF